MDEDVFSELFREVVGSASRFRHREHVHLTWLAVHRLGQEEAVGVVSRGIRRTARYAGAPQKYNETMSQAWARAVAHHVAERPDLVDFEAFAAAFPALLDKSMLSAHYRSSTLAGPQARQAWVEPDLAPFPWRRLPA